MFVMNLTDTELVYSTNGNRIRLFPKTVVEVEDGIVSAEKLKACFGQRIDIIGEDRVKKIRQETEVKDEVKDPEDISEEVNNTTAEWIAKQEEADAYFRNIEEDNDSDKHLKLELAKYLQDKAAEEDERVYDNVSLMEEIERIFPEERAKRLALAELGPDENANIKEGEENKDEETKDNETSEETTEGTKEASEKDGKGDEKAPEDAGKVAGSTDETVKSKTSNKKSNKGNKKK